MLKQFGHGIWILDGTTVEVLGFHYPTRMAVIKLSDGGVFIWSPTAISKALCGQIDAIGPVRHIVAPNSLHHLFILDWQAAYPEAKVYAPPQLCEKRPDIRFDDDLGDTPNKGWAGEVDQVVVRGNRITTEVVFFHMQSGTVLFADLIQQFPDDWFAGWRRIIAKLDLMIGPEPSVPRKFRMAFTGRGVARVSVRAILVWPAKRVLMAHGAPVTENAQAFLARAFRWLKL